MNIKLSEDRYNALKTEVSKARKLLDIDSLEGNEKEKKVIDYVNTLKIDNNEEKEFYIANFLIPNDKEFYDCYIKENKNLKKIAEIFGVSSKYVLARIFELGKYKDYMSKETNKKDDKMSNVEIISDTPILKRDKEVDADTTNAIQKINKLLEINLHQSEVITSQENKIANQSTELAYLDSDLKDKKATISNLKEEIKSKEKEINDYLETIKSLNSEITNCKKLIEQLTAYKENFDKLIDFVGQASEKENKSLKTM